MAGDDYRRLAAACACGGPLKVFASSGKTAKKCSADCRGAQAWKTERTCQACKAMFLPVKPDHFTCGAKCRAKLKLKPLDERPCSHCKALFVQARPNAIYCSNRCKVASFWHRHPERKRYQPRTSGAKAFCVYVAKCCDKCGEAQGQRRQWTTCSACLRQQALHKGRVAALEAQLALHRAKAQVSECAECGAVFCRLYGAKRGPWGILCSRDCQSARLARHHRAAKKKRKAVARGVDAELVMPERVFERDGWACRLCGISTPKSLRGSCDGRAPELDHIHPISRGGAHTYANTQCLCRSCNGFKSDMTMTEVVDTLAA